MEPVEHDCIPIAVEVGHPVSSVHGRLRRKRRQPGSQSFHFVGLDSVASGVGEGQPRLVQAAGLYQRIGVAEPILRTIRIAVEGPSQMGNGRADLSALQRQNAEVVVSVGVVGVGGEYTAIEPVGFGQMARLVVADGLLQRVIVGWHLCLRIGHRRLGSAWGRARR